MTDRDPIFDRAREQADLAAVAGVKLGRLGHRLRGQCPVCESGKGRLKDGPFWIDPTIGRWGCFAGQGACAEGGDAVDLERLLRGGPPLEAAARLASPDYRPLETKAAEARSARPNRDPSDRMAALAARLLSESLSSWAGSLVDLYLAARGIGPEVREVLRPSLRFHPEADWGRDDRGTLVRLPAMVIPVRTHLGRTGGVHLTYLAGDGSGKTRRSPAKRMFGPQTGHGRPGGALLSQLAGDPPLIVAEGVENAASAGELYWRRTGRLPRMMAALSLNRLTGGWAADGRGRYDVETPRPDPEKPAFTWPGAGEVMIAVDRDMKPVSVPVRGPGGRRVERRLTADDRARVCGTLAEACWRSAGANPVRTIAPPAGMDFNDYLGSGLA